MLELAVPALLSIATLAPRPAQEEPRDPTSPPLAVALPDDGVALPLVAGARLPMVEGTVGGAGPYRFVVEWAGNVFAVSDRVRGAAALEEIARLPDGIPVVAVPALALGEARFRGLVAEVPRFLSRIDHDGVLGLNVFRDVTATLDFPAGELRLERDPLPAPQDDPRVLVYDPGPGGSPRVPITLGGRAYEAVIDTAAESALILDDRLLPDLELLGEAVPGPPILTPRGRLETRLATIAGELVVGGVRVPAPRALVHRMAEEPEVLLGGGFLRERVLRLDQRNRRLVVALPEGGGRAEAGDGDRPR